MTPRSCSLLFAILLAAHPVSAQDIVAHRGASHTAPENTLAAFHLAWKQGADAIEGDFRLTKDGHIVCVHDEDFKRTANLAKHVHTLSLAEVQRLDVGSWKGFEPFLIENEATVEEIVRRLWTKLEPDIPALTEVALVESTEFDRCRTVRLSR